MTIPVEPRRTLLEVLREDLATTGAKEVCDRGACGACSVLVDGKVVAACMMLAIDAQGRKVVTAEGVAADPKYAALLKAFEDHDAAQCGFCIPGFFVRAAGMVDDGVAFTDDVIRAELSGNLCRCGAYVKIFNALSSLGGGGRT